VNLESLFGIGRQLASDAITSSGTFVTIRRPDGSTTVDPETLEVSRTSTIVAQDEPAVIVDATNARQTDRAPGVQVSQETYKCVILPTVITAQAGDLVEVGVCLDERLQGRRFSVLSVTGGSANAIQTLILTGFTPGQVSP
jgi:hypothetical protein